MIISSKEKTQLSKQEQKKILELLKKDIAGDLELSIASNVEGECNTSEYTQTLSTEFLLYNLAELQQDALELEEQFTIVQQQNVHLEEKVNWLRSKVSGSNFIPSKTKPESRSSLDNSRLQPALAEVINAMESKVRRSMVFSFSTSKRVRKDKAVISESEYFDNEYIAKQLEDLGLKIKDPLEFFVLFGAALELSPSEKFDTKSYLEMNPDVKDSGINPLLHYIKHGKAEGRVLI